MGWFSSKKKTYVFTSADRMIEEAEIVNSNQMAVTEYLLQNTLQTNTSLQNASLVDCMTQATYSSLPAKWGRAYNNAKGGRYYYGLPTSNIVLQESKTFLDELASMFKATETKEVELLYGHVDELNYFHGAMQTLVLRHGFNPTENTLEYQGQRYFLEDLIMVYPMDYQENVIDEDYYSQWGYSASSGKTIDRDEDRTRAHTPHQFREGIEVPLAIVQLSGGVSFELAITDYNDVDDYIMSAYLVDGQVRYFTGDFGTGEYPNIDSIYITEAEFGEFYPRMYGRLDSKNLADDSLKETEAYKSSQNFWRNTDLDWASWVSQLDESLEDKDKITQAFVSAVVPANTQDDDQIEYLFKWFKKVYLSRPVGRTDSVQELYRDRKVDFINNSVRDGMTLVIADKAYTQKLSFSHIGYATVVGTIGEVGTFKSEYSSSRASQNIFNPLRIKVHQYSYQVTEDTYEVISVYGLSSTEVVRGGNVTVAAGEDENLLIPLDRTMSQEMNPRDYEYVMARSLHLIVNTLQVVKTKWYQRGAFKLVMMVAAAVMSVFTAGQSLTVVNILIAMAASVAVGAVIGVVAKLAVKLGIKVEIVMAVAVITVVLAGYAHFKDVEQVAGIAATTINQVSNAALMLQAKMRELEMASLAKSMIAESQEFENKMQELQDLKDELGADRQLLDNALWISPATSQVFLNLGESPDDYYTRTIHAGFMGTAVIDVTLGIVENSLKLPTPQETFQKIQGGIYEL